MTDNTLPAKPSSDLEKFLSMIDVNPHFWEPYINRDILLKRIEKEHDV